MNDYKFEIPDRTMPTKCRGCQEKIYFVKSTTDKYIAVNPDGTAHIGTCKKPERIREYDPKKDPRRRTQAMALENIERVSYRLSTWEKNFIQSIRQKMHNGRELSKVEDSALMKIEHDRG